LDLVTVPRIFFRMWIAIVDVVVRRWKGCRVLREKSTNALT
jgi:hypothetical protein